MNDRRDEEENRLSARAARYVRVGTNVGAVAARVAGQRLFGREGDDAANAAALAAALGGLKGPIMKVAQMLATIPEALPAEYAHGPVPAAVAGAAHGAGVRAPAHAGRAGAGLGAAVQELRAAAGGLGLAGTGASCAGPRWRAARLQAAVSRHAVGRGGGSQPAQGGVRAARAHEPGDRDSRDPQGGVGAAARGAELRAGSAPHGALRPDLQGRADHPRAGVEARAVDQAPAHHDLARWPAPARLQERAAGGAQRHRQGAVQGVVVPVLPLRRDPRRPAPRQLHHLRAARAGRPASTCSTTAASAPSGRRSCRA